MVCIPILYAAGQDNKLNGHSPSIDDKKTKKRKTDSPEDDTKGKKRSRSPSVYSSSSESDRQPSPLPPAIVYDYFENDNTTYHIEDVTPETSVEERREIYQVADFPRMDLSDLQAGDPPDMDFTNAKPQSQVAHATFTSYTDPYFRNFTEEDLAFLRERVGHAIFPLTPSGTLTNMGGSQCNRVIGSTAT